MFSINTFSIAAADKDSNKKSTRSIDRFNQSVREEKMDSAIKSTASFLTLI